MSVLVGRNGRNLFAYGVALLVAVTVGAAVAYSQSFLGDSGPYVLVGALLAVAVAGAILWQWRLGALMLVAVLPYETTLTSGILSSGTVGDLLVTVLPYESLISIESLASGIKGLALLTFVSLALALLRDQELFERFLRLWQQPLALAVLAFVLWVSASILWAPDKSAASSDTASLLGVFGVMVFIGLLERRYLVLAWVLLVFSAALSVPAGYVLPLPEGSDMLESGRFGPAGAGPNSYACLMAIVFFVAFFGLLRRHRVIAYLLAPVFLYGIFATQSRTGLVVLVATPLLALFIPRLADRLGWRVLIMYVLGVAALAVMILAIPAVGEAVAERYAALSDVRSEDTWSGRWSIWLAALQIIASYPILGVGVGNFASFALQESVWAAEHSAAAGEVAAVAHNTLLGVASELGIVGLTLFLGILFFAFKAAVPIGQRSSLGTGIVLGLIVFTIAGMTLTWEYNIIGYVLFGSVLALHLQQGQRAAAPGKLEDSV